MLPHEIVEMLEMNQISVDEALELAFCCDLVELFDLVAANEPPDFELEVPTAA